MYYLCTRQIEWPYADRFPQLRQFVLSGRLLLHRRDVIEQARRAQMVMSFALIVAYLQEDGRVKQMKWTIYC